MNAEDSGPVMLRRQPPNGPSAFVIVLTALAGWATLAWAAPSAMELLTRAASAEMNLPFRGTRQVVFYHQGRPTMILWQKVARDRGGKEYTETFAPARYAGRLTVCNGTVQWEYSPKRRHLVRRILPSAAELARQRKANLQRLAQNLRPKVLGQQVMLGRPVTVLRITDPHGDPVRLCWLDSTTALELASEDYEPRGVRTTRSYYTAVNFSPSLPAALFTFHPPAGVKIDHVPQPLRLGLAQAEQRVGFRALVPTYLPSGFTFAPEETSVAPGHSGNALCLVFSNGLESFSVFEAPRSARDPRDRLGSPLSYGRSGGSSITVVGDLPPAEVRRVIASVKPRS
jgi:outer membrane lipoprotein-sorting protein